MIMIVYNRGYSSPSVRSSHISKYLRNGSDNVHIVTLNIFDWCGTCEFYRTYGGRIVELFGRQGQTGPGCGTFVLVWLAWFLTQIGSFFFCQVSWSCQVHAHGQWQITRIYIYINRQITLAPSRPHFVGCGKRLGGLDTYTEAQWILGYSS